jgi:hypothetical protein
MSFIGKLREAAAQQAQRDADPWRSKLEAWLRGTPEISTAAALDLLGLANTSGNARQLARTMSSLGFIAIKSKRLLPGGRSGNTVTRGWARPVRATKSAPTTKNAGAAGLNQQGMIP